MFASTTSPCFRRFNQSHGAAVRYSQVRSDACLLSLDDGILRQRTRWHPTPKMSAALGALSPVGYDLVK
jgi:hypothetical protein